MFMFTRESVWGPWLIAAAMIIKLIKCCLAKQKRSKVFDS